MVIISRLFQHDIASRIWFISYGLFRIYFAANLWAVVHFERVRIEGIGTNMEMYFEYMYTICGQDSRMRQHSV